MTEWDGDMSAPHTMQDEFEFAKERGWAAWTTDPEGFMVEDIDEPELPDFDPGPEVDDEGGMSEHRYFTEEMD